jgi:hypothetical protein
MGAFGADYDQTQAIANRFLAFYYMIIKVQLVS